MEAGEDGTMKVVSEEEGLSTTSYSVREGLHTLKVEVRTEQTGKCRLRERERLGSSWLEAQYRCSKEH